MNRIKYAAVALCYNTGCKIISDTLNEDLIFRDTVYQILRHINIVTNQELLIFRNG